LAGALLFDEKICQTAALFWFGLQDVRIPEIFYSLAVLQRTIVDSPAFLEPGFGIKDCGLCPYNPSAKEVREVERFLYESAQDFEVFSNIQA
jgi:hypothetical protein